MVHVIFPIMFLSQKLFRCFFSPWTFQEPYLIFVGESNKWRSEFKKGGIWCHRYLGRVNLGGVVFFPHEFRQILVIGPCLGVFVIQFRVESWVMFSWNWSMFRCLCRLISSRVMTVTNINDESLTMSTIIRITSCVG